MKKQQTPAKSPSPAKPIKRFFKFPPDLVAAIDKAAKKEGLTFSEFVSLAVDRHSRRLSTIPPAAAA